ncbi:MAG TPA: spore germination protein GerPE [Bacillales bacterium]|nr:spore germination protein GerPE [Bacillales bacterium]
MAKRLSIIDHMNVRTVGSSANLQIGDSVKVTPNTRALAVQREYPVFANREFDFRDFDLFIEALPSWPDDCIVHKSVVDKVPVIKVGSVDILGMAASSVVHIGSTRHVESHSRVKHIRQYFYPLTEEQIAFFTEEDSEE